MKGKKIIIFFVLAILVISALAVSCAMLFNNKKLYTVSLAEIKTLSETGTMEYVYDDLGHITKIKKDGEAFFDFTYSNDYKTVLVNNLYANEEKTYEFNENFDVIKIVNYNKTTETFEYNNKGQLIKSKNANDVNVSYSYKGKRLINEIYSNGDSVEYIYSGKNLVAEFVYNNSVRMASTYYYYNDKNLPERKDDDFRSIFYSYDENDNLTMKETSDGDYIKYTYDENKNLTSYNYTDVTFVNYSYSEFKGLKEVYKQNKVLITYMDTIENKAVSLLK